jgi:CBS domain-containing protein
LLLGSAAVRIQEIMTQSVVTAPPESAVQEVAALMRDRNVGSVVLVDDSGRPVGMVTDRDLTIDALADAADPDTPASECATMPVVTGESDMDLDEAAGLMVSHRIRRLPVMEGNTLVGIVTLDDIAVRTGNLEVAQQMTADVARAVFPEFYFHQRGG